MALWTAGLLAPIIWLVNVKHVSLRYVLGVLMVAAGVAISLLHCSVSDEYLRKHFGGEENASRVRRLWRGGWVGVLLGVVMIAAEFFLGSGR
jgi:hypothetical protein